MKKLMLSLFAAAMTVAVPAVANEAHHPDQGKPAAGKPAAVQPAPDASPPATSQDATPLTGKTDAMHRQTERLDPQEREKLLREHVQAMHEAMETMHGVNGAKKGAGMMSEQRMDMMQTMMEQMNEHETKMDGARK